MKNSKILLYALLIAGNLAISGCKEEAERPENAHPGPGVAEGYTPASFAGDSRAAQIKSKSRELHRLFEAYAAERNIPGIAYGIVVDGELVIDSALGYSNLEKQLPAKADSKFRIASMTKSFTAMGIMKLVEDGKVALEAPAHNYIPELADIAYPTSDSPPITVENLLTMTAGFPEDNPWGDRQLDEPVEMLQKLMAAGPSFSNPPSLAFEYSNTGYALLGLIISNVTGMPYQEYIAENILYPLGMRDTYWEFANVPPDQLVIGYAPDSLAVAPMLHDGAYGAMGGLITSIRDFSKYVSYHLSAWPPRSAPEEGPVRRSSLRRMQQPQYSRLVATAKDSKNEPCPVVSGYGYGLGISENCHGTRRVSHGGALPGFGSNYVFYPDLGIGLMAFCNLTYTSPWPYEEIAELLFEDLELEPRQLQAPEILKLRQGQVVEWFRSWDAGLEAGIFAENFFMDMNRKNRLAQLQPLLDQAGELRHTGEIRPDNQLRGSFEIFGAQDTLKVYFTLSPEPDPKIQALFVEQ